MAASKAVVHQQAIAGLDQGRSFASPLPHSSF